MFSVIGDGDCRSQRTDRLWGWKYRIVSPTVGAGLRIKRGGGERSDPAIRAWTWISRPAGYYQRGITIFAIRQNKIQGIMSSVLFNWHSLTLSLSECQKLHLSSHNKWRDRGGHGATENSFFTYFVCRKPDTRDHPFPSLICKLIFRPLPSPWVIWKKILSWEIF